MRGRTGTTTSRHPADLALGALAVILPLANLADVLDAHGLSGVAEEPLQTDGWSGARMTRLTRGDGSAFVIKRDSLALDWIARVTGDDPELREALLVRATPSLPPPVRLPHLAVARDGEEIALLMPDLTGTLLKLGGPGRPGGSRPRPRGARRAAP